MSALEPELERAGIVLPIYWGNRNWHPMLGETLAEMSARGHKRALAIVLAAYSSYSSCRQYREDIARAQAAVGAGAPRVDKVRVFYNHPEFIAANAERVMDALERFSAHDHARVSLAFTAHSIPCTMAQACDYEKQLRETCRLVAEAAGIIDPGRWALVYQSRSGRPEDPWLGPDILDHLKDLKERGASVVVIHPVGFLSDHLEVLYDLDVEARAVCDELGLAMVRSQTVGVHPRFITMLRMLVEERIGTGAMAAMKACAGVYGPSHDVCPETCCLPPPRPGARVGIRAEFETGLSLWGSRQFRREPRAVYFLQRRRAANIPASSSVDVVAISWRSQETHPSEALSHFGKSSARPQ